jgi:hypothetical protein
MHLHECIGWDGPITHRQFLVWQAWLEKEWNNPNRADHYAMQIATTIASQGLKEGIPIHQGKIPFQFKKVEVDGNTSQETRVQTLPDGEPIPSYWPKRLMTKEEVVAAKAKVTQATHHYMMNTAVKKKKR